MPGVGAGRPHSPLRGPIWLVALPARVQLCLEGVPAGGNWTEVLTAELGCGLDCPHQCPGASSLGGWGRQGGKGTRTPLLHAQGKPGSAPVPYTEVVPSGTGPPAPQLGGDCGPRGRARCPRPVFRSDPLPCLEAQRVMQVPPGFPGEMGEGPRLLPHVRCMAPPHAQLPHGLAGTEPPERHLCSGVPAGWARMQPWRAGRAGPRAPRSRLAALQVTGL